MVSNRNPGHGVRGALLKLAASALLLSAIVACGDATGGFAPTPTPPPGMFSTLPTTEAPIEGDRQPTIELNTPPPTPTPQSYGHA